MLHEPELLKVTVDDLDGEDTAPEAPVNILREKTFNPELSSLLGKIYSHEKVAAADVPVMDGYEPSMKISLLQKCDDLIYRLKHEEEAASVTSDFNPFSLDINVYDDIDDLNDYIRAGLKQCGFSRFLIMKYNFRDAAFRTDLNMINDSLTADVFFSVRDHLFNQLYSTDQGCLLNYDTVKEDPFLYKKLGLLFEDDNRNREVFLVRLCSIAGGNDVNPFTGENISLFEKYLSPLLIVISDDESGGKPASYYYNTLKMKMQIPFSLYVMKNLFSFDSAELSHGDALLMLELFINSPAGKEMSRTILTLEDFSIKENLFILKYLMSRIRKRLEINSFFMRISINKCILIASEEESSDIREIVDEINTPDEIINFQPVNNVLNIDRHSFASLFL
ncbi:MAG TPA: hypothetical protein PK358_12245 [Spirochaetota bacterium]|nr:hypothetical protein [Spirochaetota bacterium]HPJ35601.1 hypothetical protein [Spirochaetota bacterium]